MTHLLVSDIFPPRTGGSGRWFWETYRRLSRERYAVAVGEAPGQEAFDHTHNLRLWRMPLTLKAWGLRSLSGLSGYWRALRQLRPLLRSERVEMIHCGRCLPEGMMALVLKWRYGVPYLCYVHGEDVTTAICSREYSWMLRRVLSNAEFLIANSQNTQRVLHDQWDMPAQRVCVLHPGVDTDYFSPAEDDGTLRERLGWGDRPVILTVGRLQKRKGHDMMIRALNAIRRSVPDVLYVVAGAGEERPALDALVASEGAAEHVHFFGEISDADLLECYRQCDLFVLPNRQVGKDIEGFGMVLLEAQACGKAVVAGASGGTAETMRIPETGAVVCCDGPDQLARLVSELLSDRPRLQRMGEAAREWVVSRFDWKVLTHQAEQVFRFGPSSLQSTMIPEPTCP